MEIKTLLFDADGTLFNFEKAEKVALEKTLEHFKINQNLGKLSQIYNKCNSNVWEKFEKKEITAKQLRIERFRLFLEQTGIKGEAAQFSKVYINELSQCSYLLNDAKEIVQELYGKYELALITNGLEDVQKARIYNSDLSKFFSQVFISEEIGFPKPDTRIFDYVFKKILHKNKEQVLIVGDNLYSDIKGGNDYGIFTCWFNPHNKNNKSGIEPEFEINSLPEIKKILGVLK
ncbi:MAG TPA: noncanonical pyrimidine nucleotidase, YjjG family [Candidatus Cloacimonas sp.]|nr:noncanonical pyrimidine nucleotidase, YjjG family [Candidatus Cloacimonas sp.]